MFLLPTALPPAQALLSAGITQKQFLLLPQLNCPVLSQLPKPVLYWLLHGALSEHLALSSAAWISDALALLPCITAHACLSYLVAPSTRVEHIYSAFPGNLCSKTETGGKEEYI